MSKIEEIADDTEIQQVDKADSDSEGEELSGATGDLIQSRSEKKARKLIAKHGLKQITGINRVTLRRPKNVCAAIACLEHRCHAPGVLYRLLY